MKNNLYLDTLSIVPEWDMLFTTRTTYLSLIATTQLFWRVTFHKFTYVCRPGPCMTHHPHNFQLESQSIAVNTQKAVIGSLSCSLIRI